MLAGNGTRAQHGRHCRATTRSRASAPLSRRCCRLSVRPRSNSMSKLETSHIDTCKVYHLPGRDWYYLLGPQNCQARNLVFGLATFPGGTLAAAHVHEKEEEIIYILSGRGAIIADGDERILEPGVAVYIPPGLTHRIRADGPEPLHLVTLFSPPVTPGAYDRDGGNT
ncbi:MAG: cupin domain-containing protein [Caldilineae bacterium]|nr:MAG: cupin domain-containing protein [Caldilineae bacterium]